MTVPLKVVFIAGFTRSGSTLLGNLLGELDGWFFGGEILHHAVRFGVLENRSCGCGRPFRECPVWSRVAVDAALDGVAPREFLEWHRSVLRTRNLPRLLRETPGRPSAWAGLDRHTRAAAGMYREIQRVTGARVIIDSSKWAPEAAFFRLLPGVDARIVHLVRDPRAVAHSWRRKKGYLRQFPPGRIAVQWSKYHAAAEWVCRRHGAARSVLCRYEDLVERPRESLRSLVARLGEPAAELPLEGERTARFSVNHTVWGNPDRFRSGDVELRRDDEWRGAQRLRDRALVTGVTLPLLVRFGYPLVP